MCSSFLLLQLTLVSNIARHDLGANVAKIGSIVSCLFDGLTGCTAEGYMEP